MGRPGSMSPQRTKKALPWERPSAEQSSYPATLRPSPKPNSEGRKLMHSLIVEHGDSAIVGAAAASRERLYATTRFKDNADYAAGRADETQFVAGIDINRFVGLGLDASSAKRTLASQPTYRRENIAERARLRGAWVPPRSILPMEEAATLMRRSPSMPNSLPSCSDNAVTFATAPSLQSAAFSLHSHLSRRCSESSIANADSMQPRDATAVMQGQGKAPRLPEIRRSGNSQSRRDPLLSRLAQQDDRMQRGRRLHDGFRGSMLPSRSRAGRASTLKRRGGFEAKAKLDELTGAGLLKLIRTKEHEVMRQIGVVKSNILQTGRGKGRQGVCRMSAPGADLAAADDFVDRSLRSFRVKQEAVERQAVAQLDRMAVQVASAQHEIHCQLEDRRRREVSEKMQLLKVHGLHSLE